MCLEHSNQSLSMASLHDCKQWVSCYWNTIHKTVDKRIDYTKYCKYSWGIVMLMWSNKVKTYCNSVLYNSVGSSSLLQSNQDQIENDKWCFDHNNCKGSLKISDDAPLRIYFLIAKLSSCCCCITISNEPSSLSILFDRHYFRRLWYDSKNQLIEHFGVKKENDIIRMNMINEPYK